MVIYAEVGVASMGVCSSKAVVGSMLYAPCSVLISLNAFSSQCSIFCLL